LKEIRYFYVPDATHQQQLPDEEAQHAIRVLRLKEGDEMVLMDGCGAFHEALVTFADKHHCLYEIRRSLPQQPAWRGHLHLAVAPTKMMERIEWLAEKATEVGFDELSFLDCQFSERRTIKTARIEKIVVAAMKQSRKAWLPQVNEMESFRSFIQKHTQGRRYIAHCYEEVPRENLYSELLQPSDDDVLVMIGPEGDFSIEEVRMAVDAGFVSVDLGKSRLRTETAALAAVMMMQLTQQ
jgi:16S rRNA (uracil1498-N3)-methyltransferase